MPASRSSRPSIPRCSERDFWGQPQPFRIDGAFSHPVVLWLCGASRQPPHKPKAAADFPLQQQNAYGGLPEKSAIRRVVASSLPFVCYIFQFVYSCIYYPFCISFIGYLPLFGSQTDLFSQKNPAFLPYKRRPRQRSRLPVLPSGQLRTTPLSVYCRFRPAFHARSVLFYLKYTNRKAKCRQLPVFSLKESWFILSLL